MTHRETRGELHRVLKPHSLPFGITSPCGLHPVGMVADFIRKRDKDCGTGCIPKLEISEAGLADIIREPAPETREKTLTPMKGWDPMAKGWSQDKKGWSQEVKGQNPMMRVWSQAGKR